MKIRWIGQHIWDFISRFRNDVYLENLQSSNETTVLVVDSDGKITKNTVAGPKGDQGDPGPKGDQGDQGPAGNTNFIAYEFNEPLSTWVLEHNLNTYPTVTLTDSNGAVISGNVVYTDSNTITVTFVASKTKDDGPNDVFQKYETPFGVTGFAYIN
jgi:hypothetical protein